MRGLDPPRRYGICVCDASSAPDRECRTENGPDLAYFAVGGASFDVGVVEEDEDEEAGGHGLAVALIILALGCIAGAGAAASAAGVSLSETTPPDEPFSRWPGCGQLFSFSPASQFCFSLCFVVIRRTVALSLAHSPSGLLWTLRRYRLRKRRRADLTRRKFLGTDWEGEEEPPPEQVRPHSDWTTRSVSGG